MKKILFAVTILLSMFACNNSDRKEQNRQNDSLMSVINDRDSSLNSFIFSFNEIESNLDSVAAKQKIISLYTDKSKGELSKDKNANINAEIVAINNLMDENRKELERVTQKLKNSKTKNAVLEKSIKILTIQLSQKDYELCELNIKMNSLNAKVAKLVTEVDSLTSRNYIQSIIIDYQTQNIHSTYYVVGNQNFLIDRKIIDRKGGLLGIGKTSILSKDLDNSIFTSMDYTKTTEIAINGSNVKVITSHPSDSYLLEVDKTKSGMIKNLTIINPEKFWSVSKYLVIVKD